MVRWAGYLLVAMGCLHGIMSVVLFRDALADIWNAGLFSGLGWSMEMLAAFWFAIFTWLMILLGLVIIPLSRDFQGRRLIGWSFIMVPILCGLVLPASGLWAFVVPGLMLLVVRPEGYDSTEDIVEHN